MVEDFGFPRHPSASRLREMTRSTMTRQEAVSEFKLSIGVPRRTAVPRHCITVSARRVRSGWAWQGGKRKFAVYAGPRVARLRVASNLGPESPRERVPCDLATSLIWRFDKTWSQPAISSHGIPHRVDCGGPQWSGREAVARLR